MKYLKYVFYYICFEIGYVYAELFFEHITLKRE